ncbi:MAG TPA: hypothetical protein H9870_12665 [Candidatus Corynebacterium avicola]|uniref:Uncharacterized protein n=1 Tax=Candidatus Corynebacterium avicola TaxID=2838527 RepID=A0A9D1RQ67_9CORY|nr:hypothetical protein [Candidatus Corynebacterium avicola]
MSNQQPYRPDPNRGYGQNQPTRQYSQQQYNPQQQYGQQQYGQAPQPNQPRNQKPEQSLLAGMFDTKKVIINLVILGVLCAVISFAILLVVDLLVSAITGWGAQGPGNAVVYGAIAGIVGVLAGLLYIPVVGTGNENLFGMAIVALTLAAIVIYVLSGGLLDGDWNTILTLAAILCTAGTAYLAPTRIESARVR